MSSFNHFILIITFKYFLSIKSRKDFFCGEASTCEECISIGPDCAWCSDLEIIKKDSRCFNYSLRKSANCLNIEYPTSKIKLTKSEEKNSLYPTFPKFVEVDIRNGETLNFNITVQLLNDIPLDLYILMDFSKTMEDDLNKLKQLTSSIGDKLLNSSKNRIGLGLFVDKPVSPFAGSWVLKCCVPTFSFRNILPLTNNIKSFKSMINTLKISSNIDTQEGTLDAIHQVAVCGEKIGWRSIGQSRRLIFVATDGRVKMAGDGRIAGIVRPHDGKCHLNSSNEYDKDTYFDYPTLHMVKDALIQNQISVIFAATEDVVEEFKAISNIWKGVNTEISLLNQDSSNLLTIIEDLTLKLFSRVSLSFHQADEIKIEYDTICQGSSSETQTSDKSCLNMKMGGSIIFMIHISTEKSKSKIERYLKSTFQVTGLSSIELTYKVIRACQCNSENNKDTSDKYCNGNGAIFCGECRCNRGWSGRYCDCDPQKVSSVKTCKDQNKENATICSSRGTCVCGRCECLSMDIIQSKFTGDYCQCSDSLCLRYEGLICGGVERGVCDCNKCLCAPKYSGSNCAIKNCSNDYWKSECMNNHLTCGNNGICKCGVCICNSEYDGRFCENKRYALPQCSEYLHCVSCNLFENKSCDTFCNKSVVEQVEMSEANKYTCKFENSRRCTFYFNIELNGNIPTIKIKHFNMDEDCQKPINLMVIGVGIATSVAAIGIITILIGYYLNGLYNRNVLLNFDEEKKSATWIKNENPLYTPLFKNYTNPLYHKLDSS